MKLYFHIHGTTAALDGFLNKPLNFIISKVLDDLFTGDPTLRLIPLEDSPIGTRNFDTLYDEIDEENRFYFQWDGALGVGAWERAAHFFYDQVINLIPNINEAEEAIDITILGHSHGGNIARIAARFFAEEYQHVQFHIITVATPLSYSQSIDMPENVKTWLHFFNKKDKTATMGSKLMSGHFFDKVPRQIENLYVGEDVLISDERHWQSFELTGGGGDPHNNAIREQHASEICVIANEILYRSNATNNNTID